ncbi:MAG: 2-oxoacid:acceptor oxidoreductase family protein [Oscillospiraceae bacterium]
MAEKFFDIYIVGVGGQGVLTISDIITKAAYDRDMPVNYYPTKGMAQRGGFVKVQLRLGRRHCGPDIPLHGADLLVSMELSETLKGIVYLKEGGECFLYANKWLPTAVMLGKAPYPELESVCGQVKGAGGEAKCLSPDAKPLYDGAPVRDNLFVLGGMMKNTALSKIFTVKEIEDCIIAKWPKAADGNLFTFRAGLEAPLI